MGLCPEEWGIQVPNQASQVLDPCRGEMCPPKQLALETNETTSRKSVKSARNGCLVLPSLCTDLLLLNHQLSPTLCGPRDCSTPGAQTCLVHKPGQRHQTAKHKDVSEGNPLTNFETFDGETGTKGELLWELRYWWRPVLQSWVPC